MAVWRNWSGSVSAKPSALARPRTEVELQQIVRRASALRVAGAGHSFMPLCETDGVLVSLDALEGDLSPGDGEGRVWAPAGWSLAKLTEALWARGLSLPNQGDVNPQALAGAIATGTHGTGDTLGSLSTIARGFRLVLADGSVASVNATSDPELYEAQRLSLGLLGVVTQIEIACVPAYRLEERITKAPLGEVEARWSELSAQHRHVEFWMFPYADDVILKTLDVTTEEGEPNKPSDMDETIFRFCCDVGATFPGLIPSLQRFMMGASGASRRVGPAYKIFPSERTVRFEEMEYELPRAAGFSALREALAALRTSRAPVTFPFEFRIAAADDIWLSPFNKGAGSSISMHQYAKMPFAKVFAEAEPIFRAHGGRPHWAKRHTLRADEIDALYPQAPRFRAVRDRVDPSAKFANAHLRALFGVTPR